MNLIISNQKRVGSCFSEKHPKKHKRCMPRRVEELGKEYWSKIQRLASRQCGIGRHFIKKRKDKIILGESDWRHIVTSKSRSWIMFRNPSFKLQWLALLLEGLLSLLWYFPKRPRNQGEKVDQPLDCGGIRTKKEKINDGRHCPRLFGRIDP